MRTTKDKCSANLLGSTAISSPTYSFGDQDNYFNDYTSRSVGIPIMTDQSLNTETQHRLQQDNGEFPPNIRRISSVSTEEDSKSACSNNKFMPLIQAKDYSDSERKHQCQISKQHETKSPTLQTTMHSMSMLSIF